VLDGRRAGRTGDVIERLIFVLLVFTKSGEGGREKEFVCGVKLHLVVENTNSFLASLLPPSLSVSPF